MHDRNHIERTDAIIDAFSMLDEGDQILVNDSTAPLTLVEKVWVPVSGYYWYRFSGQNHDYHMSFEPDQVDELTLIDDTMTKHTVSRVAYPNEPEHVLSDTRAKHVLDTTPR